MRPEAYTNFDLRSDFMHAVNLDRESKINQELEKLQNDPNLVTSMCIRDELIAERAICRVKVRIFPGEFNDDMERLSEQFSDSLYEKLKAIDSVQKLLEYNATMEKLAWEAHSRNRIPPFFLTDFSDYFDVSKFETADDRLRFRQISAIVYFALLQRYTIIRKIELYNK